MHGERKMFKLNKFDPLNIIIVLFHAFLMAIGINALMGMLSLVGGLIVIFVPSKKEMGWF